MLVYAEGGSQNQRSVREKQLFSYTGFGQYEHVKT